MKKKAFILMIVWVVVHSYLLAQCSNGYCSISGSKGISYALYLDQNGKKTEFTSMRAMLEFDNESPGQIVVEFSKSEECKIEKLIDAKADYTSNPPKEIEGRKIFFPIVKLSTDQERKGKLTVRLLINCNGNSEKITIIGQYVVKLKIADVKAEKKPVPEAEKKPQINDKYNEVKPDPPKPGKDDEFTEKKAFENPDPNEPKAWSKAKRVDAAWAYREYLQSHPESTHSNEANERVHKIEDIDNSAWRQVLEEVVAAGKDDEKICAAYRGYVDGPFLLDGAPVRQVYLSSHKAKAQGFMRKVGCQRSDAQPDSLTVKNTLANDVKKPETGGGNNGLLWVGIIAVLLVMGYLIWGQSRK